VYALWKPTWNRLGRPRLDASFFYVCGLLLYLPAGAHKQSQHACWPGSWKERPRAFCVCISSSASQALP